MRGYLKRIAALAPHSVVDFAKALHQLIPGSLRYGKAYREALALFEESDRWDLPTLSRLQEVLLRRLIDHCWTNVPYYRRVLEESHLAPQDIQTADDLQKLPLLTKEIVRNNKHLLRASSFPAWRVEPELTAGSTGQPLDFAIDLATRGMERALAFRQLSWLGYRRGDIVAEIKSHSFADPRTLYQYSPVTNELRFSAFRLNDAKLGNIVRLLNRFKPAYIKSYPSVLYILTRWMERHKQSITPLKYVITSSETLYPVIKEQAERILKTRVIDHYGQNEQVAYAFQCSEGKGYHIQMEQNVVELTPIGEHDSEIVGTSLYNFAMPFLRYRTGDLASKGDESCPCGRKHPLLSEIRGKKGDVIVTPERSLVSLVAMTYVFDHVEAIKEAQIIQEDINTLRVKLVPWESLTQEVEDLIRSNIVTYANSRRMNIIIEATEEIPRNASGKKPFIISRLDIDDYL